MTDTTEQRDERYNALCDRALEFVSAKGGIVPEDMLITHVFGSAGSPSLWRPLLRDVLGKDDRLIFHANGEWAIPAPDGEVAFDGTLLDEFVALDVETTGLKPSRQRVIEIALVRYRDGQAESSFETLLNPERGIPEFITKLTTISNEHVREAPIFKDVAANVVEFIGDSLIIGHNVTFDINFLNAELGRVDLPELVNERLDTMGMAVRFLKPLRKPSLDRVADAVGLSPRKIHRAGDDARLTAEVAFRLVREAQRQGVKSLDQMKASARVVTPRVRDDVGRARAVMDRSLAHAMPKKTGVYLMKDARGEIIYVGKAKNLRDRVSSYYSQPIGYTRKMDGLIESVTRIDHEVVGSELEALLLEAQLIHRLRPRYNTALKKTDHYPYIKVDVANPWPRVLLSKSRKDDGARYYGPYRSANSARKTVDVINRILPLRTCTRSFRNARSYGKPCIALDLGQCLGPCTGKADKDEYRQAVDDVIRFLDGQDDALNQRLLQELQDAAVRLDFNKAARLRQGIRSVQAIEDEQTRIRNAEELHNLLLVLPSVDPGCREVMIVIRGRLWAQLRVDRVPALERTSTSLEGVEDGILAERPIDDGDRMQQVLNDLAGRLRQSLDRAADESSVVRDQETLDESSILNRFLFRNAGHPALIPLTVADDGALAVDTQSLALRVLSVDDDTLATLDAKKTDEVAEETDQSVPDASVAEMTVSSDSEAL
ncbi:MAG TPA: exonuclease domain-containing protein [Thermomicrobiales bacterium]|nr:exonuclease domain-containing protein [Thermomicrobiales bacterium]